MPAIDKRGADIRLALVDERPVRQQMLDAPRMLVSDVDRGSLILEHSDQSETQRDLDQPRAIIASAEGRR